MTDIQHRFADIYDRLNGQPDLQELIATPFLNQFEDEDIYTSQTKPYQDLVISRLNSAAATMKFQSQYCRIRSFAAFVLYRLKR